MSSAPDVPQESYTVLARRYRPTRFEECIGQEHVAQALENAIESQRVAHAYLFCGSRGVGKTSMARIFAKALNCQQGPTAHPCGTCESCLSIAAGSDLDVVEIDGASNRGIEEIRELRQGVAYRPSRSRFKIYIIDEVHMLTKEAFNALLKTLEEPPAHVKFIFATTEAQKIPITILSRCQRYDFASIGLERIHQRLAEIVAAEGMTADDEAIDIVARRARGSMRDSQSLLDQVLAYAAGHLTPQVVHRLLGTAGEERVLSLAQAIFAGDAAAALPMIEDAIQEGIQLGEWIDQMLDFLRDLLVLSVDRKAAILSMPQRQRPILEAMIEGRSPERIMEYMDILAQCRQRLKGSPFGRTLVEMTVVRLCRLDQLLSVAVLAATPSAATALPESAGSKKNGVNPPGLIPAGATPAEMLDAARRRHASATPQPSAVTTSIAAEPSAPPPVATVPELHHQAPPPPLTPADIKKNWPAVRAAVKDPFLSASLDQVATIEFEPPRTVLLVFPATAEVSKSRCEANIDVIRPAWESVLKQPVQLRFSQKEGDANAARSTSRSPLQLRDDASRDPVVQQAEMLLGARIFDVVVLPNIAAPPTLPEDDPDKRS